MQLLSIVSFPEVEVFSVLMKIFCLRKYKVAGKSNAGTGNLRIHLQKHPDRYVQNVEKKAEESFVGFCMLMIYRMLELTFSRCFLKKNFVRLCCNG